MTSIYFQAEELAKLDIKNPLISHTYSWNFV
jgi:hypothetical protein